MIWLIRPRRSTLDRKSVPQPDARLFLDGGERQFAATRTGSNNRPVRRAFEHGGSKLIQEVAPEF
jgi:hypothetical protein